MNLKDLSSRTGASERTIRYLIAEALVPAAKGTGRGADAYDDVHLAEVLECVRLMKAGLSVPAIKVSRLEARRRDGVILNDGRFELRLLSSEALRGFSADDLRSLLADVGRVVATAVRAVAEDDAESHPQQPLRDKETA